MPYDNFAGQNIYPECNRITAGVVRKNQYVVGGILSAVCPTMPFEILSGDYMESGETGRLF